MSDAHVDADAGDDAALSAARLLDASRPSRLHGLLRSAFSAGRLPAASQRYLRSYALAKLRGMQDVARALGAPEDREELLGTVAALWLELRFEWERHNRVANYQVALSGHADATIVASAAICSGLLAWLEEAVPATARDIFGRMTVELLAQVHRDVAEGRMELVDPAALAAVASL